MWMMFWGCELMEAPDADNQPLINEIVYTIDNTTKTRAIFEINKGIGKIDGIDVNSKIPQELRRVKFENMIYIADGPSDIPAFSPCTSKTAVPPLPFIQRATSLP